jgi:hypothetical protein
VVGIKTKLLQNRTPQILNKVHILLIISTLGFWHRNRITNIKDKKGQKNNLKN